MDMGLSEIVMTLQLTVFSLPPWKCASSENLRDIVARCVESSQSRLDLTRCPYKYSLSTWTPVLSSLNHTVACSASIFFNRKRHPRFSDRFAESATVNLVNLALVCGFVDSAPVRGKMVFLAMHFASVVSLCQLERLAMAAAPRQRSTICHLRPRREMSLRPVDQKDLQSKID
jgi:hypothetical protein